MSNPDLVQYIIEQASLAGDVTAKKMFGDYCLYCDSKVVGLMQPLLHDCDQRTQPPYEGAKPHYVISDVDDRDYLSLLVKTVADNINSKKRIVL